jgi:hypothetical protein
MATETYGDLYDYQTGDYIREASRDERDASRSAADMDGGAGVILIDAAGDILRAGDRGADEARRVYVQE